jgi:PAS domain S-box-containing protein
VEVVVAQREFADRTYTLVVARESRRHDEAEEILRETEERYTTLFALTQDAVYVTGDDGCIVEVNDAAVELLGYQRDELIGLDPRNLYADAPDASAFEANVEEHGFVKDLSVPLLTKDGSVLPGLLTATPRRSVGGGEGGFQCLVRRVQAEPSGETVDTVEPTDTSESSDAAEASDTEPSEIEQQEHAPSEDYKAAAVAETEDLIGSWVQYEEMKAETDPGAASIEDLIGATLPVADVETSPPPAPRTTSEAVRKVIEELRRATESAAAAPTTPLPRVQASPETVDQLRRVDANAPTTPLPRAQVDPEVVTDTHEEPDVAPVADTPDTPEPGVPVETASSAEHDFFGDAAVEEPPFIPSRPEERRNRQESSEVEVRTRARIQRRTSALQAKSPEQRYNAWPLAIVLGVVVALVGWTNIVALTYGYNNDAGLREWQLTVRMLGLALLGLGMAGQGWKRTSRVVSVLVLLLAVSMVAVFANFLASFPFELRDAVPETRRALDIAILQASGFTVAICLFSGWVYWRLWSDVTEPPEPRPVSTGPHQRVAADHP